MQVRSRRHLVGRNFRLDPCRQIPLFISINRSNNTTVSPMYHYCITSAIFTHNTEQNHCRASQKRPGPSKMILHGLPPSPRFSSSSDMFTHAVSVGININVYLRVARTRSVPAPKAICDVATKALRLGGLRNARTYASALAPVRIVSFISRDTLARYSQKWASAESGSGAVRWCNFGRVKRNKARNA